MFSVPNKPKTPLHAFRVDDDQWRAAQERAKELGETVSDVLRRALAEYAPLPEKDT
jgi:negative regulator of replication initiation